MDEACKRMRTTIRLQKGVLSSFNAISGLMCYKMADLANLALKNGYYFQSTNREDELTSPKDDWIESFCKVYENLKEK